MKENYVQKWILSFYGFKKEFLDAIDLLMCPNKAELRILDAVSMQNCRKKSFPTKANFNCSLEKYISDLNRIQINLDFV